MWLARQLVMCVVAVICIGQVSASMPFLGRRKANAVIELAPQERRQELQLERDVSILDRMAAVQKQMESIETMPSCKKIAAKDLVHSCESFRDRREGQTGGDEYLETFQKLFAIRMTNCDQLDAGEKLPASCQPLLEPDLRSNIPQQAIKNCLQTLNTGGTNQWVTYNRVKLEGLIMCHAMRTEADKDDIIHLHKILFGALGDVNGAIVLQKNEIETLVSRFWEIGTQIHEFRDALHNDNNEIKAEMKGLSDELKGNMVHINENAQDLLSAVAEANKVVLDYSTQVGSAIQLARSQGEQNDAQLKAALDDIAYLTQQHSYELEQFLAAFHANTFNMTQSMDIANAQTSIMAGKMAELTVGLEAPLQKLGNLNSGMDEVVAKQQQMQESTSETLENLNTAHKLARSFLEPLKMIAEWIHATVYQIGVLAGWLMITFIVAFSCMLSMFGKVKSAFFAAGIATWLSLWFTIVHSPIRFVQNIFARHPVFTSPAFLSVLVTGGVGVVLGGVALRLYQSLYQSRVVLEEYEYDDEDKYVDRKV